jgi:hypothetical protein
LSHDRIRPYAPSCSAPVPLSSPVGASKKLVYSPNRLRLVLLAMVNENRSPW